MIVCLCHGVSDGELRSIIRRGASSVGELTQACGAGGDCGSCREQLCHLLDEAARRERASEARSADSMPRSSTET
jgi:bacterioferritin-associated ferredoxin